MAIAAFIIGSAVISCKSNADKEAEAVQNMQEATQDLNQASQDLNEANQDAELDEQLAANNEEWNIFKNETKTKIDANETIIANLKLEIKKEGTKYDAVYAKNIELLENKNARLRARIEEYDKTRSDWETFKREFNSDMEELGVALKDLTVNNKK